MYKKLILISSLFLGVGFSANVGIDLDEIGKEFSDQIFANLQKKMVVRVEKDILPEDRLSQISRAEADPTKVSVVCNEMIFSKLCCMECCCLSIPIIVNKCEEGDISYNKDTSDVRCTAILDAIYRANPDFFRQKDVLDVLTASTKDNTFSFFRICGLGFTRTVDKIFDILTANANVYDDAINAKLANVMVRFVYLYNVVERGENERGRFIASLKQWTIRLKGFVGLEQFNQIVNTTYYIDFLMQCVLDDNTAELVKVLRDCGYTFDKDTPYNAPTFFNSKTLFDEILNRSLNGTISKETCEVLFAMNPDLKTEYSKAQLQKALDLYNKLSPELQEKFNTEYLSKRVKK